ncbi:TPA: phage minor tail protein L [Escherichia coli]|nr:phage minor tail protein L [Escherichia coli]
MSQPAGDLVIDLSLDAARFDEQMARVRRHFSSLEADARKTASTVEQGLSRQALAAQKAGISVGQYKAAMRTLPAQFTDIVTQLAGGQNPFLIMLQQGGQISDSFGGPLSLLTLLKEELLGIRDASESSEESLSDTANALAENARNAGELGRFMSVARVAAGGGVAVLAALAAAAWQAEQADRALLRSLILTGGAAATTTAELWKMAGVISDEAGGGIRQAAENLARLAESGKYTAGQLRIMGETSQRWLQTVGDDAGKVEKAFEGIAADPVKALASLNQQYNFLSVSQLRHIDELERTKGKQAAVTEAITGMAEDLQSLVGATVVRRRVYARFLDAVNFVAGNPEADPEQELSDRWVVEQMSELTAMTASFVLATPTETDGALFPGRIMLANTCMWDYRGDECGYNGPAVADEFDKPTTDIRKDRCSKCMRGCEMRGMVANFGGFLSINKLSQ